MAREVKGKTNLDVAVSRGPFTFDRIAREGSRTKLHVIYIDYVARVAGGELKAGSDVGVTIWFSRKELDERWGELHEDTQRLVKESGVLVKEDTIVV